jgi:uncharacterized protein
MLQARMGIRSTVGPARLPRSRRGGAVEMPPADGYVDGVIMPPSTPEPPVAAAVDPRVRAIVAELRRRLEALYGGRLDRVVLHGSHARGDADAESDIDVLVVLRGEVRLGEEIRRTSEIVGTLALQHDVALSRTFVPVTQYAIDDRPLSSVWKPRRRTCRSLSPTPASSSTLPSGCSAPRRRRSSPAALLHTTA